MTSNSTELSVIPYFDTDKDLSKYDALIFDLDGVVWHVYKIFNIFPPTFSFLKKQGKQVFFCTNNSTAPCQRYVDIFVDQGIPVESGQVFSSANSSALHLKEYLTSRGELETKKVLLIGETGLYHEFQQAGVQILCSTEEAKKINEFSDLKSYRPDPDVAAVIVGFDRQINYTKIALATIHILELNIPYFATNPDTTFHIPPSRVLPEAQCCIAPITSAVHRDPIYIGKPSQIMLETILRQHAIDPKRALMIGDRLDTDIQFGSNGGLDTLLVFSGVTRKPAFLNKFRVEGEPGSGANRDDLVDIDVSVGGPLPTYVADHIAFLIKKDGIILPNQGPNDIGGEE